MARPKHLVTPVFGWEYPELGAEADVPVDLHELALQIEEVIKALEVKRLKTAGAGDGGKILIVKNTGEPVWLAINGDATTDAAALLTIGNEKIGTAKLQALAVTAAKLAAESVEESKIKALAVTAAKVANEAISEGKIANLAVALGKLSGAVQAMLFAAGGESQHFWSGVELSHEGEAYGSFSTPIRCTIPVLKPSQLISVSGIFYVLGNATAELQPAVALKIEGNIIHEYNKTAAETGKYIPVYIGASKGEISGDTLDKFEVAAIVARVEALQNGYTWITKNWANAPLRVKGPSTEKTNVQVELQGLGKAKQVIRGAWLHVAVSG